MATLGRHHGAALRNCFERLQQPRRLRLLEQVAAGPGTDRLEHALVIVIYRQHDGNDRRVPLAQNPHSFDSVQAGKPDIVPDRSALSIRNAIPSRVSFGSSMMPIPTSAGCKGWRATGLLLDECQSSLAAALTPHVWVGANKCPLCACLRRRIDFSAD
jgi:hypothetical protein